MSVPINLDWPQFKDFVAQFSLKMDYAPEGINYFLFSSNGSVMLSSYLTDPTEVLEFETIYKPFSFEVSIPPGDGGPGTLVVQGTTPWVCSISGTPSLPAGAATAARQDTGNASLSSIDGKIFPAGQALMAASSPVVLASNQSAIPVTQSGPWNVAVSGTIPISAATLPLPAGAATEATLATRLSEATFTARLPLSGQIVGKTGTLVTTAITADQIILTYTVTAGKTFYLEGFDWSVGKTGIDHADSDYGNVSLELPSGVKIQTWFARGSGKDGFSRSIPEPLSIAAGTVIRLVVTPSSTTSMTWVGNLIGYEK